jgi:hypothetical protein
MYFFPSRLVFMFAVVAVAFSAPAQQTIISSKPADLPADKANSFLPSANHHAGDYNAPVELFHDYTPDLPMPPPLNLNNNGASVQEALDKRKNWTLLTPEQILGVQTPEEILGVEDRPEEKNLSLEEQFLLRERRETAFAATNGRAGNIDWRGADDDNPFNRKNKNDGSDSFPEAQAKNLLERGNPVAGAVERHHAQRAHPLIDGELAHFARAGAGDDEFADLVGDGHRLDDGHTAGVAGIFATIAAASAKSCTPSKRCPDQCQGLQTFSPDTSPAPCNANRCGASGVARRTRITEDEIKNGAMPMSSRRAMAPGASLQCIVDSTWWPVSAASMAISAVSVSRISPIMMMSGSWRKMERSALAKDRPISFFVGTWLMPGI